MNTPLSSAGFVRTRLLLLASALFIGLVPAWIGWHHYRALPAGLTAEYVGRQSCVQCHPKQHNDWTGSHHDLAMDHASEQTVLGDFNDVSVEFNGVTSKFFRKDGRYYVYTQGRRGEMETFELKYTFGVTPLQQYLAEFERGRLQALPIAWDVAKKQWFHLYEKENVQPDEWLHWTNRGMNWNFMCADCHSTNLQKNYDQASDSYHTTWSEIDVSCEACHGPASLHLKIVERGPWGWDGRYGTGLAKLKGKENQQTQLDACGKCHARRQVVHPGFEPGDDFLDHFAPELLDTPAYHADGQILEEDYEYTSFHLSLMHSKGVRCTDCHDPHSSRLKLEGNKLCLQCHMAGRFDQPTHHFHDPASTGARCVECHMPETTYMRIDPRRDHGFRIPRPDLTLTLGIPNACTRCHQDKSAEWSAGHFERWYGKKDWPRRIDFAADIQAGRRGDADAEKRLLRLSADKSLPAFLRASATSLLRNYDLNRVAPALESALADPHPLVRAQAARNLEEWLYAPAEPESGRLPRRTPIPDRATKILPLLDDASNLVRFEAARVLAAVPRSDLPADAAGKQQAMLKEFIQSVEFLADDPAANHNLANLYESMGQAAKAEEFYERALARDETFNAARFNLAMLYYDTGRNEQAAAAFQEVIRWSERQTRIDDQAVIAANKSLLAQTHFSLALLLAEKDDQQTAVLAHFKKALEYDPSRHRVNYNLGLLHSQRGEIADAERELRAAYKADPQNADYGFALGYFYANQKQYSAARQVLTAVLSRHPNHAGAVELLQRISSQP